jgi:hypothetical protein
MITEQKYARNAIDYECRKHRMTYERAGQIFQAMMLDKKACEKITLAEIDNAVLRLPPAIKNHPYPFALFLDYNADRLQLFDTPKKLVLTRTSGNIHCSHFPDEIKINPDLDKWEYVEELS